MTYFTSIKTIVFPSEAGYLRKQAGTGFHHLEILHCKSESYKPEWSMGESFKKCNKKDVAQTLHINRTDGHISALVDI